MQGRAAYAFITAILGIGLFAICYTTFYDISTIYFDQLLAVNFVPEPTRQVMTYAFTYSPLVFFFLWLLNYVIEGMRTNSRGD